MNYVFSKRRRHRRSRQDYTRDSSVRWFVVLILALAVYIIIQTLVSKGRDAEKTLEIPQRQQVNIVDKPGD